MRYTPAKLRIPKTGKDWYVYYSCSNPETELMERFMIRNNINRLKTDKEKRECGNKMVVDINIRLKEGWSPFVIPDVEKEKKDKSRLDFYWWFDGKIKDEAAKPESFYNWRKQVTVQKKLKAFAPVLSIHDLDYKFLKDFEAHLLGNGDSLNYVADTLVRISGIMKIIVKSGDVEYHRNPFNDFTSKTTKIKKRRITLEDIGRLEKVFLKNPNEKLARDMYIFSFYLAGMRFGDICRVRKDWFSESHTEYTMNKSKNDRKIKLLPQVVEIIKRYKRLPGEYLFDTKVDWSEPSKTLASINSRNRYFNQKLKLACKATVELDRRDFVVKEAIPEVTFHTARHSFADLAKSKLIDVHTIKDLLGHSKVQTTEIYMKSFYKEETDEAMDKIFGNGVDYKSN
jgi:integrase